MKPVILSLDAGHPGQMETLSDHFQILKPDRRDPEETIRAHGAEIKAIVTYLTPVGENFIKALPNLEIIACGAVGTDHIDLQCAHERGVAVTNTPGVLTADTADLAMLLMLSIARRAVEGDAYVRAGLWKTKGALPLGVSLTGKRAGIVGLGRIGGAIAVRAEAFGMDVVYHGPRDKPDEPYPFYDDLADMARNSDFLILSCPGGEDTKHLVTYGILEALGPSGFLINVARGSVVNENDLLRALSNKKIAGAALDVYENEPYVPEALVTMDNVILTPHIGSATLETRTKMGLVVVGNLLAHFDGRPLLTPVRR